MKYKNIKSMLHNFGHSFVSLMNYVDGEYAIDLLHAALKALPQSRIEIHFPSQRIEPAADYSPGHVSLRGNHRCRQLRGRRAGDTAHGCDCYALRAVAAWARRSRHLTIRCRRTRRRRAADRPQHWTD